MVAFYALETWRRDAIEILRRYKTITDDLQRHGYSVSAYELADLEREAMDMRWRDVDELASKQSGEPRSIKVDFAEIDWDGGATREQWDFIALLRCRSEARLLAFVMFTACM